MAPSGMEATTLLFVCAAMAFLTVPGANLFYGAEASRRQWRSVLLSIATIPIVAAQWWIFGHGSALWAAGGLQSSAALGPNAESPWGASAFATAAFSVSGIVVACAIMMGALSGRLTVRAHVALLFLWSVLVYDPIAQLAWASRGWPSRLGVLDFAGGIPIHVAAGTSSLACATFAGKHGDCTSGTRRPSVGTVGAVLLCLGCVGLTIGAGWAGRGLRLRAFFAAALGASGGALGWLAGEAGRERGKRSALGIASCVGVGLAATTSAGGYVSPGSAFAIGVIAAGTYCGTWSGLASAVLVGSIAIIDGGGHVAPTTAVGVALLAGGVCYAVSLAKKRLGDDPSRDPFGVHTLGGVIGAVLAGVLARGVGRLGATGALFGNVRQFGVQLVYCAVAAGYAWLLTFVVLGAIDATMGLYRPNGARADW
jgi:ammonium transporter, Amt family